MGTMGDRLRKARIDAGFKSARSAAQRHGWKESSYAAHENGQNEFGPDVADRYARAFRVSAAWLLTAEGPTRRSNIAPVVGLIGAGAEIHPEAEQVPPEGLYEIEVPFPIPDGTIAFEVEGESMWPRYDPRDVVICLRDGSPIEEVLGFEAAVRTKDGRRYLKRVLRGRRGLYDLESHNAQPIRGVKLEWVSGILGVVRSGQWRKLNDAGKNRALSRIVRHQP